MLVDTAVALIAPLILLVLACYRLTRFIVFDDGPWQLMFWIRVRLGVYDYGENGRPRSMLGEMFSCPHCIGMWVAALMAIGVCWTMPWPVMLIMWLATAGGQSFLESR